MKTGGGQPFLLAYKPGAGKLLYDPDTALEFLMKRRILLVDDDVAILLTLKAVLEISGFEVETAASAREAKLRLKSNEYHMVITDLRMESETAGQEVAAAAKKAPNQPAVAMLTAYPPADADWTATGTTDKVLVKPMNTQDLLRQIEAMLVSHEDKKRLGERKEARGALSGPGRGEKAAQAGREPRAVDGSRGFAEFPFSEESTMWALRPAVFSCGREGWRADLRPLCPHPG